MKYVLLAFLFLTPIVGVYSYEAYHPDMDRKSSNITWVRDPELVDKKLRSIEKRDGDEVGSVVGLASWKGGKCTIYALEPTGEDDHEALDTLGHEMLHCMRGKYHD